MKQEKTFFETMAGSLSPGWTVKLQSHLQPGRMDLGRFQVRLYLVDTSNGLDGGGPPWHRRLRGGTPQRGYRRAEPDRCARCRWPGDRPAEPAPGRRRRCRAQQGFQLVAAALTGTQTFKAVPPGGVPATGCTWPTEAMTPRPSAGRCSSAPRRPTSARRRC